MNHQPRKYRNNVYKKGLYSFRVLVKETDLLVQTEIPLEELAIRSVSEYRGYIENYIKRYPKFATTLEPWIVDGIEPAIIKDMAVCGFKAGVGPMAAVAGAVAQYVGMDLLKKSNEVIIENGGDIFIKTHDEIILGVYAGMSPLSMKIGIKINPNNNPISVCTSSGTVGHSLSFGNADAVCVISKSCPMADAAATAICNQVKKKSDISNAIGFGKQILNISGVLIIMDDKVGAWGEIEIVPIS
ncbi:MAG: UPF0280 family protein [Desulfobacterales bacterium]|nr:UPF0280 family protein [Desulfobacterales bacterium]